MSEWYRLVQTIVEEVDECIKNRDDETLTLSDLSKKLGYSGDTGREFFAFDTSI